MVDVGNITEVWIAKEFVDWEFNLVYVNSDILIRYSCGNVKKQVAGKSGVLERYQAEDVALHLGI